MEINGIAAIGAGLSAIGAGIGIGMIIAAALVEGVALFGVVVALMQG
jgi:F0F1-type ATP synthase membrane subunit c/vacuolar-type H+-ATPase subunit K